MKVLEVFTMLLSAVLPAAVKFTLFFGGQISLADKISDYYANGGAYYADRSILCGDR